MDAGAQVSNVYVRVHETEATQRSNEPPLSFLRREVRSNFIAHRGTISIMKYFGEHFGPRVNSILYSTIIEIRVGARTPRSLLLGHMIQESWRTPGSHVYRFLAIFFFFSSFIPLSLSRLLKFSPSFSSSSSFASKNGQYSVVGREKFIIHPP